jgi:hypothetical protein
MVIITVNRRSVNRRGWRGVYRVEGFWPVIGGRELSVGSETAADAEKIGREWAARKGIKLDN